MTTTHRVEIWTRSHPAAADAILAVALALTLGTATALTVIRERPGTAVVAIVLASYGVMHAAVAIRRTAPVLAFVAATAAEAILVALPLLPSGQGSSFPATVLPSGVAFLIVAYSVSAWAPRPWPTLSLVAGWVGAIAVTLRFTTGPNFAATAPGGQLGGTLFAGSAMLASVTAMWALGAFGRWRRAEVAALAERAERAERDRTASLVRAVMDERQRIAREMHDIVAHSLSVMVRQAEGGRYAPPERSVDVFGTIAETGREALRDMRSLLGVLRTADGQDGPQPTIDDVAELVERVNASGLPVTLQVAGQPRQLDRSAQLAVYRLVQEALTNVVKHAGPDATAEVLIDWAAREVRVEVVDTGASPPATLASGPGRGQVGMSERLELVGGHLQAGPLTDGGYRVTGVIPTRTGAG